MFSRHLHPHVASTLTARSVLTRDDLTHQIYHYPMANNAFMCWRYSDGVEHSILDQTVKNGYNRLVVMFEIDCL